MLNVTIEDGSNKPPPLHISLEHSNGQVFVQSREAEAGGLRTLFYINTQGKLVLNYLPEEFTKKYGFCRDVHGNIAIEK